MLRAQGMAESHVISALKAKQEEIKKRISDLKKKVAAAQQEYRTVSKTIRIFGENPRTGGDGLSRRGDLPRIVFDTLRSFPEGLDVDQLAAVVIKEEEIDAEDPELAATVR
jgi:hypothetical protein